MPLIFFLLFKRNNKEKELRVILFYILYCILNETLSFYLQSVKNPYFILLISSFTIIEYSFFCYFLYSILPKGQLKNSIIFVWIGFLLFAFIDFFYVNKMKAFDSFASGTESIIIILLCIYYLFSQIKRSNNLVIYSTFNFWIIITFLLYFSGTFFLYLLADTNRKDLHFQKLYFIINISFNIFKNILLCVAMTMKTNSITKKPAPSLPDLDDGVYQYKTN